MTDTVAEVADRAEEPTVIPPAATAGSRRNRILLVLSAVASVVPFFWAAIRDARNGFYPILDVAATVTRARATFSAHPPLVGMWSSGSTWAGHEIHFPGAIQLYLLAIPTQLFGNSWGPLLAMAVLNSFWILLAGWLIYRYLGVNAALLGFLFLNLFIWSIGSENLIDPRPMEMVTIPFLCFLFLVWLVTSGDIDAVPGLAVVANFLFLDHLVMALQIPVIGLCAVAGVVLFFRNTRAGRAGTGPDEHASASRRRLRRRLLQAALITFIMWLPSLIQQVTNNPGNLTLLVKASGQHRNAVGSFTAGYNVTIRLLAEPTFWFRGRFADPSLSQGVYQTTAWDVVAGLIVAGLIGGLGWAAWRRRDNVSLAALAVSVVAIGISIVTVVQAPAVYGFPMQYLRSLWGLSAFVWFAVALGIYRLLADHVQLRAASVFGIGAVVFGVLGLSYADFGSETYMGRGPYARAVVDRVVPQLTGRGKVNAIIGGDGRTFESQRYFDSLVLGLDTAGVHFCVDPHTAQQYGPTHDCAGSADVSVLVQAPERPDIEDGKLLARVPMMTDAEKRELASTRAVFEDWLADRHEVALTPAAHRLIDAADPVYRDEMNRTVAPADGDLSGLTSSEMFRLLIAFEEKHRADPEQTPQILADADAPVDAMSRYFELTDPNEYGNVWVYEVPNP